MCFLALASKVLHERKQKLETWNLPPFDSEAN